MTENSEADTEDKSKMLGGERQIFLVIKQDYSIFSVQGFIIFVRERLTALV